MYSLYADGVSSSSEEEDTGSKKLILTRRVKENIVDLRVERLKRESMKKCEEKKPDNSMVLYDGSTQEESDDEMSSGRKKYGTRGNNKRKLRCLMDSTDEIYGNPRTRPAALEFASNKDRKEKLGEESDDDYDPGKASNNKQRSVRSRRGRKSKVSTASSGSPRTPDKKRLFEKDYQDACDKITESPNVKKLKKDTEKPKVVDADDDSDADDETGSPLKVFQGESSSTIRTVDDYLKNPPPGVLGAGKGEPKKLPAFEFNSLYQYQLPSLDAGDPWLKDPATVPDDIELHIKSLIGVATLGCNIDLMQAASRGINLSYDPKNGIPLVMRRKDPPSSAMIFKSGRMIINGTKTEQDCRTAADRYARILQKLGFPTAKVFSFRIANISATCNVQFRVRVHLLAKDPLFKPFITYYPEMHAAVCIRLQKPQSTVMVFCTGSVLITGCHSLEELRTSLQTVYPLMKIYAN